jgi:nucleoid DNA-binding protein
VNKQELIEAIAKKRRINQPVLEMAYDEIFVAIVEAVAAGEVVEIPQFGKFHRTKQHLSRVRVPSTKTVPDFSPDLNFRDAVTKGGN